MQEETFGKEDANSSLFWANRTWRSHSWSLTCINELTADAGFVLTVAVGERHEDNDDGGPPPTLLSLDFPDQPRFVPPPLANVKVIS